MLDCTEIACSLIRTPAGLRLLLEDVNQALNVWRPQPGEWCINEIVGHLIAADGPAFADRIQTILTMNDVVLAPWSEQEAAHLSDDVQHSMPDLLAQLERQRRRHAEFVKGLQGKELARSGRMAPYGRLQASDFLNEWIYHDLDHTQQILQVLKLARWSNFTPGMQAALSL